MSEEIDGLIREEEDSNPLLDKVIAETQAAIKRAFASPARDIIAALQPEPGTDPQPAQVGDCEACDGTGAFQGGRAFIAQPPCKVCGGTGKAQPARGEDSPVSATVVYSGPFGTDEFTPTSSPSPDLVKVREALESEREEQINVAAECEKHGDKHGAHTARVLAAQCKWFAALLQETNHV